MGINKYNAERYPDPTAYEALTNVWKERQGAKAYRPIVYICSPYAGDVDAHVNAAKRYCRFAVDAGYLPIAPHLLYPQFMDDRDERERKLGLRFGDVLMDRCAEVWVFGADISAGMQLEINRAKRKGYTLRFFNAECEEVASDGSSRDAGP